ncbi:MAG: hypothetical protein WBH03_17755, partial [Cyclobacteriaceae bacterium]
MKITIITIVLLTGLLLLNLPVTAQDYEILRVENVRDEWNKLKLGNNPNSFWNPNVDITAGGNTHLEVEFRVSEGTPDMSRIQIRPNGYSGNPVNFADYLPADFSFGFDWYTISIPLADFDSLIDLTSVYLLQLPYSNMAGTFVMEFRSITFAGGSTPYIWFGNGKRDNIHDGFGFSGQMIAAVEKEFYFQYDYNYPGQAEIEYFVQDYNFLDEGYHTSIECQEPTVSCAQDNVLRPIVFLDSVVSNCEFISGNHSVQATLKEGTLVTGGFTVPFIEPLSITSAQLTPPADTVEGNIEIILEGGRAPYFFDVEQETFNEGVFYDYPDSFQWGYSTVYGAIPGYFPDMSIDLAGNVYIQDNKSIQKVNSSGQGQWLLDISNGYINQVHADPDGTLYVTGVANYGFSLQNRFLGNDVTTSFAARVSSDGKLEWLRQLGPDIVTAINSNGKGSIYLLTSTPAMIKMKVNGRTEWEVPLNNQYGQLGIFGKITFDDSGNVFSVSSYNQYGSYTQTPITVLNKVTEDGSVVFSKRIEGAAYVRGFNYHPVAGLTIIDYRDGPFAFNLTTFRAYYDDGTINYTNTIEQFH